jgi:glutaminase
MNMPGDQLGPPHLMRTSLTAQATAGRPLALGRFLDHCHAQFTGDMTGMPADYIPELKKADPTHFGIALATIDGHVYATGDSDVEFTIQSISKPFVFALALDRLGAERVNAAIGVEPSGEAFNSIRLTTDNRPFNPMVNAGAIACSGLIHSVKSDRAFECIHDALNGFAGRKLGVDEAVFASERVTGDRNRAIGYMLRNYDVITSDVDEVLEAYFRQCSILLTARDLAVMAATLANRGMNPLTGEQVVSPYAVARTLSVMTSSGMYDYAGEWIYRVGIPAKSGVGGGIIAALPGQFGLGTFSPPLDAHGNSVRGIRVCELLSSHFELHMLNRSTDVRTTVIADYNIKGITSRRKRQPSEQEILDKHCCEIRVIELVGALAFANADYVTRAVDAGKRPAFLIIDLRRVPTITEGAALLFADMARIIGDAGGTILVSGKEGDSDVWRTISRASIGNVRRFDLLDEAIEWSEDQVVYRRGGYSDIRDFSPLDQQALLAGLSADELAALRALTAERRFHIGEQIVAAGSPADSIFFLLSGMVSVKLPSGVGLASLSHGMVFGEMALLEAMRSADVWADTAVTCLELQLRRFNAFCKSHPHSGHQIMRNLADLLSKRLIQVNTKVGVLSAY